MKKVFVTLEEFINNGGQLDLGQKIYIQVDADIDLGDSSRTVKYYLLSGKYCGIDEKTKEILIKCPPFIPNPIEPDKHYIEIEVTPIYKAIK